MRGSTNVLRRLALVGASLAPAICGLALLGTTPALAQDQGSPENAPTLEQALSFIRDRLAEQGQLNYVTNVHDSSNNSDFQNTWSDEQSNVTYDVSSCRISFHWKTVTNGKVFQDKDAYFTLSNVTDVQVQTNDETMARIDAEAGHPTYTTQTSPPLFIVYVVSSGSSNLLEFRSQDTANRVAKAITYASHMCGGMKSPF